MPATKAGSRRALLRENGWKLQIVKRRERASKITGLTWNVARTFASLGRNRQMSKDYEYAVQTSETMIDIAAIRLNAEPADIGMNFEHARS